MRETEVDRKRANHKAQSSIPQAEMGSRKEKNIPTKKQNTLIIHSNFWELNLHALIPAPSSRYIYIYTSAVSRSSILHLLYTVKYILNRPGNSKGKQSKADIFIYQSTPNSSIYKHLTCSIKQLFLSKKKN